MAPLSKLAKLVRSKNAGPFIVTFDILFDTAENYQTVKKSGLITPETFARLYDTDLKDVRFFSDDRLLAFKISIPRKAASGDPLDTDGYAGQIFGPLADLEIPT